MGICAALGWLGCAEGQDITSGSLAGQGGKGGSSSGGGGSLGNGGVSGGNGGTAQGGSAQGGSAQGGSSQGGSGPGGSAQGGSAQGGSVQPGDASRGDAEGGVAGGGGRDASGDGNAGSSGTGGTPVRDATVDRADVAPVDARNDMSVADAVADRATEATITDGSLCSTGNTCSPCAEQRCPAQACALCQDVNHVSCATGCSAILDCVIQHDGCATDQDPICFNPCSAVINAQPGGSAPRDWAGSLIRCSCF